jgi:hypothetical protein
LDYKKKGKKSDNEINLYYEWDGCYLLEEKEEDITLCKEFNLPFYMELKYKLNKTGEPELINNNILIKSKSIAFIEVKSHFPKEEEDDHKNNLENVIKVMFSKLNYFVKIHLQILKNEVESIKIVLLYNQNRLTNYYQDNIKHYIKTHSKNFSSLDKYEVYFDILYIIPAIGIVSLNRINERVKQLEEDHKKIKQLEEDNKKIKQLEEKINELEKKMSQIKPLIPKEKIKDFKTSVNKDSLKIKEDDSSIQSESEKYGKKQKQFTPKNDEKKSKIYKNIIKKIETVQSREKKPNLNNSEATSKDIENKNVNPKSINLTKEKSHDNINIIKNINVVEKSSEQLRPNINEIKKEKSEANEFNKDNNGNNGKNKPKEKESKKIELKKEKSNKEEDKNADKPEKKEPNKSAKNGNETLKDKLKKDENNKINFENVQEKEESSPIEVKENKPEENVKEEKTPKKIENISQMETEKNININVKSEMVPKKTRIISANTTPANVDEIYARIKRKLDNKETLLEKERIYLSIYNDCKKKLKENNFSLIALKRNHTGGKNEKFKNAFHYALKNLKKEERNLFFEYYEFWPCMSVCSNLIDY